MDTEQRHGGGNFLAHSGLILQFLEEFWEKSIEFREFVNVSQFCIGCKPNCENNPRESRREHSIQNSRIKHFHGRVVGSQDDKLLQHSAASVSHALIHLNFAHTNCVTNAQQALEPRVRLAWF